VCCRYRQLYYYHGRPPAVVREPIFFAPVVYSFLIFVRPLISEITSPIVTKVCHMFDGNPDLKKLGETFGESLTKIGGLKSKNIKFSAGFRTTLRLDREYLRNSIK